MRYNCRLDVNRGRIRSSGFLLTACFHKPEVKAGLPHHSDHQEADAQPGDEVHERFHRGMQLTRELILEQVQDGVAENERSGEEGEKERAVASAAGLKGPSEHVVRYYHEHQNGCGESNPMGGLHHCRRRCKA